MIIEAHRGVECEDPQNTMASFMAAKRMGYGMIELDTKFTRDDRCVILHDRTINRTARTTDGSKLTVDMPINELTLEDARAYDYGVWMNERFKGEKIPLFDEALCFAMEQGIPLKIDNVWQSHTAQQQKILFDTVEKNDALEYVGFTCSSADWAELLINRFPQMQVHYDGDISEPALGKISDIVPRDQLTIWLRYHNERTSWAKTPAADGALCDMAHRFGKVGLWLLTTEEELEDARSWNVDIIETDGSIRPGGTN